MPVEDHWKLLLKANYALNGIQLDEWRCPGNKWANGDFCGNPSWLPFLWMGELYDTGPPNLKVVPKWLRCRACPGPQICPAEFKDTSRRAKGYVSRRDFLVIESDDLPLEVFGNVALFVTEKLNLNLRAVVYTGGKSIHCWFDYNWLLFLRTRYRRKCDDAEHFENLAVLTGLGCDPKMFGMASTTRMPGCERLDDEGNPTGRWQRLVYLNPKFTENL